VARPTYNLHQRLNIMDPEPTSGKLFCVNQQHASIHQPTQHVQIYTNSNVPSLGLEQQHEELCSNTPRDDSPQNITSFFVGGNYNNVQYKNGIKRNRRAFTSNMEIFLSEPVRSAATLRHLTALIKSQKT